MNRFWVDRLESLIAPGTYVALAAPAPRRYRVSTRQLRFRGAIAGLLIAGCTGNAALAQVQSEKATYRVVRLAEGLENPWALAFLPDGRILVTERPGRLRIVENGALSPAPLAGVPPVWANGQGGLFDLALHPEFAANRLVYFSYAAPVGSGALTRLARGRLGAAGLENVETLFDSAPVGTTGRHFGGRIAFGRDGKIYLTTGDRGEERRAQDGQDLNGKLVRLEPDGKVPGDNPFVGRTDIRPEIFALGIRNTQGLVLDTAGNIWGADHGAQGGDELNRLERGQNYGWPTITFSRNYGIGTPVGEATSRQGYVDGRVVWTPSIAPSGLVLYQGAAFPGWQGSFLVGGLVSRALYRVELRPDGTNHQERLLAELGSRIRDVRVDAAGRVHILTDARNGFLARLDPN
jgi:glucose/arabinose dehydrogenase